MAQGRLLLQDTFMVSDPEGGLLGRMKERRVFLFEQLVIFSEPLDKKKGFSLPGFLYKNSIKVRDMRGSLEKQSGRKIVVSGPENARFRVCSSLCWRNSRSVFKFLSQVTSFI